MQKKPPARPKGITTLEAIGIPVALGLILLPEPMTTAAGVWPSPTTKDVFDIIEELPI